MRKVTPADPVLDNTQNRITPIIPGISVTLSNNATSLVAGKANGLVLSSMAAGIALDGAMLHARDAAGKPVGNYTDAGGVFVAFPGCGRNKQGQHNGVVHSMLITCNVRPQFRIFKTMVLMYCLA